MHRSITIVVRYIKKFASVSHKNLLGCTIFLNKMVKTFTRFELITLDGMLVVHYL